uniref:Potassium channel domain-containing protein n=1 Tax=Meloidogyne incognita TaxID=6306 RepID=A0A914N5K1_MELIC
MLLRPPSPTTSKPPSNPSTTFRVQKRQKRSPHQLSLETDPLIRPSISSCLFKSDEVEEEEEIEGEENNEIKNNNILRTCSARQINTKQQQQSTTINKRPATALLIYSPEGYGKDDRRSRANSVYLVSSDILRAQGYSQQFKSLLSTPKSRRDSVPGDTCQTLTAGKSATPRGAISQQQSLEERCNGDLTQPPPSSILVNSSAGVCEGNNNNYLLSTTELNLPKSLEWSPTIEEEILNKNSNLADPQQQTNLLLLQQKQQQILRRRQSGYGISITTESQAKMRCKLQLTALKIVSKNSLPSLFLRSACVASTLLLIASLVNYHRTEVKIALIDSGAEDWRVAVTTDRIIKLFIEIFICAICPFPGSGTISWPYISADEHSFTKVSVPLDVLLAVPMFLRAYLLCRFMVLHSRQFQDAATRSIAALNRISMDFRFVIKTMMADHPMTVLVIFTCCYWVCMSWMFTQCERYNGREASTEYYYMNSLWFIMVTFMSIGYGDVVPTSYCGRFTFNYYRGLLL